jgi:NADPH-dependent 2,4-dienoyl-CoA reductase/sulfur reductase-like enzyme
MNSKKHYKVIIIGAGPAGVGVAVKLHRLGVTNIAVVERNTEIGGIPSFYKSKKGGVRTFVRWSRGGIPVIGESYAKHLEKALKNTSADIKLESQVLEINIKDKSITYVNPKEGKQTISADAIVFATGAREKNQAERQWVAGARPSRVFFTKQLLNLTDRYGVHPINKPVIIGSDVIAYAVSAKLRSHGAAEPIILDEYESPQCPVHERTYFKLYTNPKYYGFPGKSAIIKGRWVAKAVEIGDVRFNADGIVLTGELTPNSELPLMGKLSVKTPSRIPVLDSDFQFPEKGWFGAGNFIGGFHGAEWCYFHGRKVAKKVAKYL